MSNPSKTHILSLYRHILRQSRSFSSYNFRSYALRRAKESFREHKDEKDPERIRELVKKAEDELEIIKRAAFVNRMFSKSGRIVVEDQK